MSDVLLGGTRASAEWSEAFAAGPGTRFSWETQRSLPGGRADIVLNVDGHPHLVIENKVDASVRGHPDEAGNDGIDVQSLPTAENANQLRTYGRWLAKEAGGSAFPQCLVLLTHRARPPADFLGGGYGVEHVSVCRWRAVWKWAVARGAPTVEGQLFSEFSEFLWERSMASDYASLQDIAKAQVYLESADRVSTLISLLDTEVEPIRAAFGNAVSRTRSEGFFSDPAAIWSWFYVRTAKGGQNWHVGWGLRFPNDGRDFWSECIPAPPGLPFVFVTGMTEGKMPNLPVNDVEDGELHAGWSRAGDGDGVLLAAKPLHEFSTDPDTMASQMAEWVKVQVEAVTPVMVRLAGRVT